MIQLERFKWYYSGSMGFIFCIFSHFYLFLDFPALNQIDPISERKFNKIVFILLYNRDLVNDF